MTPTRCRPAIFILLLMLLSPVLASSATPSEIPYGNNPLAGQFAEVNGIEMYYEIYGSGEPLLLIHGNGQSIADMHFQVAHFSGQYKVIVADSRGHGKTGLGEGPLNYVQMMEDYNSLLEQLDVAGARVFGWSDGGIITLMLTIQHPDKVSKIALMGANLRPDQTAVYDWVPRLLDPVSDTVDNMIASHDSSENWLLQRQLLDLLKTQPHIPVDSLHGITVPVLVMAGDKDIIRIGHSVEIFENLGKAHLAILPGQTHWAPTTDPIGFNALLETFFRSPYSRPTSQEILTAELNPPQG